jgi:hypothetical protein
VCVSLWVCHTIIAWLLSFHVWSKAWPVIESCAGFLCLYYGLVCVWCDKPSWPGVTEEGAGCECCHSIIWEECACMCIWCACISIEMLGNDMFIKVWHTFNIVCTCSPALYVWLLNAILKYFIIKKIFYHLYLNCSNKGCQNTVFRKIFWFRGGEIVWG